MEQENDRAEEAEAGDQSDTHHSYSTAYDQILRKARVRPHNAYFSPAIFKSANARSSIVSLPA